MITFLIFVIGLFLGSFLGVLVDRIARNETVVKGRSRCEFCKKELEWLDLIPLFSFIFLKGKCRYCHKSLPFFYPVIELTTGLLLALIFNFFMAESIFTIVYFLLVTCSLIVAFFMDIKYGIIADKILYPTIFISLIFFSFFGKEVFLNHISSGILSFLLFLGISFAFYALTKKQGMGGGDIKLSFLLGLFLGFPNIVICLYLAFLTGAIASIILILWGKKKSLKDSLPFGPFLIVGAFISLFFGNMIFPLFLAFLGV